MDTKTSASIPTTPVLPETVPKRPCAYLAGPMALHVEYNFPLFHEAAHYLRTVLHWDVISPAEMDMALGFDATSGVFTHTDWCAAMRRDIAVLLEPHVDRIVFLPRWQTSRGANIERTVGEAIGLKMWYYLPGIIPAVTMVAPEEMVNS